MAEKQHVHQPEDTNDQKDNFDPWESFVGSYCNQQGRDHKGRSSGAESKKAWPEVVGLTIEEAENIIKQDKPDVHFQIVEPCYHVTMDVRPERVRFFVDFSGKVQLPPTSG